MAHPPDFQTFSSDLMLRFDELAVWAISHWPDPQHRPSRADFDDARAALARVTATQVPGTGPTAAPEPAAGGPQYINSDAAPWP